MGEESNDQMSDYSEDFEEDMESEVRETARPAAVAAPTHAHTPKQSKQTSEERAPGIRPTPRNVKSHPVRRRLNDHRKLKAGSRAFSEPRFLSKASKSTPQRVYGHGKVPGGPSPRDRVLSAKQHTIRMLQNELADAKRVLEEMKKENRLLNRLQVRQEKDLGKFQSQEGELPQILLRHAEEVRVVREQLRKSQETAGGYQRKLNELRQELLRVSDRKKKLEEVVKKKHLLEREALTIQLQVANDTIEEKDRKITELGRNFDLMVKNHSQETRTLLQKNRALHQEAEGLRDTTQRVHTQLREKEKEMDIMNIYTQRIVRSVPQSNIPRLQAPAMESAESQTELSCPPSKVVSLQTRPHLRAAASQTEMELPKQPASPLKKLVPAETQTEIPIQPQALQKKLVPAETPSNNTNITSPKPVGASTTHKLPITGEGKEQQSEVRPAKEDKPHDVAAKSGGLDAERQKKDFLLAKLKTLDAQKGPPGSQSMSDTKSSAKSASNNIAASADHTGALAPPSTSTTAGNKMATRQQKPSESHSEQQKKKLLLAKLMAIDEGSDPSKVIPSKPTVPAKPDKRPLEVPSSATHSSSSLHSWPDTVENMYKGKPAYSSEGDPFGVQHSASKLSAMTRQNGSGKRAETSIFLTESETESTRRPKFGRRQREASLVHDIYGSNKFGQTEDSQVKSVAKPPEAENYTPSFEHRARNVVPKLKNEFVFGGQDRGPSVFGGLESRSGLKAGSKGPLLPMRPKAEPVRHGLDVMPGALGEPDDIEELVL